ncbi:unnamed protein product [Arctogadus glacialis]
MSSLPGSTALRQAWDQSLPKRQEEEDFRTTSERAMLGRKSRGAGDTRTPGLTVSQVLMAVFCEETPSQRTGRWLHDPSTAQSYSKDLFGWSWRNRPVILPHLKPRSVWLLGSESPM